GAGANRRAAGMLGVATEPALWRVALAAASMAGRGAIGIASGAAELAAANVHATALAMSSDRPPMPISHSRSDRRRAAWLFEACIRESASWGGFGLGTVNPVDAVCAPLPRAGPLSRRPQLTRW